MSDTAMFPLAVYVLIGLALLSELGSSVEEPGISQTQVSRKALSENDRQIGVHAQRMFEAARCR